MERTSVRRVIVLVGAAAVAMIGIGLLGVGATLGWAHVTQRDDDGFFTTSPERFETGSAALTSETVDLGRADRDVWWADREVATVRISVEAAGERPVFVGIGPRDAVATYLADVPHDEITDVDVDPFSVDRRRIDADGSATPVPPGDQTFWVAQGSGESVRELTWNVVPGEWTVVLMNADGTKSVVADVEFGARIDVVVPIAIALVVGGVLALAIAAGVVVGGVGRVRPVRAEPIESPTSPSVSPLRLEGDLDGDLSRWKWLVKWFLAIPHFVVLLLLWVAFVPLTLVAGVAILFTGRYPRPIFDFCVGVLRWSWRVTYYATSVFGTDRYPPFTLRAVDHPARLDVVYPDHLSRRLVLVKSWLLALPHLLIVWAASAGWADDGVPFVFGGGLLGLLTLTAAMALLVTGRYPIGLFDVIMGAMRWTYRTVVYVALMTDVYPPFRLDQGGAEPTVAEPTVVGGASPPRDDDGHVSGAWG